jgi:hypothetical protein
MSAAGSVYVLVHEVPGAFVDIMSASRPVHVAFLNMGRARKDPTTEMKRVATAGPVIMVDARVPAPVMPVVVASVGMDVTAFYHHDPVPIPVANHCRRKRGIKTSSRNIPAQLHASRRPNIPPTPPLPGAFPGPHEDGPESAPAGFRKAASGLSRNPPVNRIPRADGRWSPFGR